MILLIDNYDSFVENLARYCRELGFSTTIYRNNKLDIHTIEKLQPTHIIISPGPCTPNRAGISVEVIRTFAKSIPILGVCLGHQAIGQAFNGVIAKAKVPMHGKSSLIEHNQTGVLEEIPTPVKVARYHSLVVAENSFPRELEITARSVEGEIMALQHKELPVYGVQFHPESVLTDYGYKFVQNFLSKSQFI